MSNPTLFDKAAEILQLAKQRKEWQYKNTGASVADIDLSPYVSNDNEAWFLCRMLSMVLRNTPSIRLGSGVSLRLPSDDDKITDKPHPPGGLTARFSLTFDSPEALERFQQDNSLGLTQQPRTMSATFQPANMKQALDFVCWKESTRWAQAKNDNGFKYAHCESHGLPSGMMFFSGRDSNAINWHFAKTSKESLPPKPADWVCAAESNMEYPDMRDLPQIWSARGDLWIPTKHAKAILVDFIGLDAGILGITTGQQVGGRGSV